MKNLFLAISAFTLVFSCRQVSQIGHGNQRKLTLINDSLNKNLESAYEKDAIVGFSVAVVDEKGLRYDQGFGFTDIDNKKAYTSNTTQNIGSISKTLIGIALLKAQELGKLNINDPINKYLPFKIINPNHPEVPILIKHLAYHTSTIVDLDEVYGKSYVLTKNENAENEGVYDYFNKQENNIPVIDFMKNSPDRKWKMVHKEYIFYSKARRKI